jgi:hypothetical protein
VDAFGNLFEESRGKLFVGWVFSQVNRDEDLFSFRINIANINTSLVSKENPVTLKQEHVS